MCRNLFTGALVCVLLAPMSIAHADSGSSVWTTGIVQPTDGAFGTPASVTANTIDATITSNGATANVQLSADNGSFLRTTGSPNVTNDELAPFFENDVPITNLSFMSDTALNEFDLLFHNVWNQPGTHSVTGANRINYVGNFEVYYENGTIVSNALPIIRSINSDSPFSTDLLGGTLQPEGLGSSFDGGNNLQLTTPAFDPGNGAPLGYYLFDPSVSILSETQGFGIVSFDESVHGGITRVDFTWVGKTEGINTAFVGVAGTLDAVTATIPEPASGIALLLTGIVAAARRRRV